MPRQDPNPKNIRRILMDKTKLEVFVASISPASSDRERACELYAQIRGLRTFYGITRAALAESEPAAAPGSRLDFSQKGANARWLPDWGKPGGGRVHFVGHSMGGTTIRALERLMRNGDPSERPPGAQLGIDPAAFSLFSTNPQVLEDRVDAIKSISTISTPHDGSYVPMKLGATFAAIVTTVVVTNAIVSNSIDPSTYTLDLDRINIPNPAPVADQGHAALIHRMYEIAASDVLGPDYQYLGVHDLRADTCAATNTTSRVAYPEVAYFAVATAKSKPNFIDVPGIGVSEVPLPNMAHALQLSCCVAGNRGLPHPILRELQYPREYVQNDGAVPLRSGRGPHIPGNHDTGRDPVPVPLAADGTPNFSLGVRKGHWQYVDRIDCDHLEAIGLNAAVNQINFIYATCVAGFVNAAR